MDIHLPLDLCESFQMKQQIVACIIAVVFIFKDRAILDFHLAESTNDFRSLRLLR